MKLNKNFMGECVCVWEGRGKEYKTKTFHGGSMDIFLNSQYHHLYSPHSPPYISYATSWKILSKKSRNFIFDYYFLYSTDLPVNV